ncbi:MAG: hypothetical protein MRJ92_12090 [Nitrospira sp.]|nr:hypothetical protein [Nitrospira sp.]
MIGITAALPVDSHPEGELLRRLQHGGQFFEWVSDWYDPKYYGRLETMVNPTGPEKPLWLGGTGTYVDRLTVGEKARHSRRFWIAPEGAIRSTHRFWNHPLNNSYGVGLGFRCAKLRRPTGSNEFGTRTSRRWWKWGGNDLPRPCKRSIGDWHWIRGRNRASRVEAPVEQSMTRR